MCLHGFVAFQSFATYIVNSKLSPIVIHALRVNGSIFHESPTNAVVLSLLPTFFISTHPSAYISQSLVFHCIIPFLDVLFEGYSLLWYMVVLVFRVGVIYHHWTGLGFLFSFPLCLTAPLAAPTQSIL